ncbi:hypothetical protein GPECTOR_44g89 [Gonium pectorale]|uniref:Uncharacterized protein n=1 Tax=Gonium pectorale TaxID=33097 RepID=A0A150GA23_GONPE|nr:hypothetical protein GPECTOR_44g89 [Gonium pectorale]|eukprot:KXZ46415.1 hypothetical protein GPECTOR_44g89 [Gonium pectorale]
MGSCSSKEEAELAQQVLGAQKAKSAQAVRRLSALGSQEGQVWITRPTDDIKKEFKFGAMINKGQFGTIYVVTNGAGDRFACKQISKRKLTGPNSIRDIRREIEVLHHLRGPCGRAGALWRWALGDGPGGDLFERMESTSTITERSAAALFRGLVETVSYCHTLGVVHRDLKPENFLITDKSPDAAIKLADFGLSCFFREGQEMNEVVGSPYYIAPEVVDRSYGKGCDVWSLGVILHILLSGQPPFTGNSDAEILKNVRTQELSLTSDPWPSISRHARHLVSKMLEKDPERRLRMDQVLTHPWLRADGTAPVRAIPSGVRDRISQFHALNTFKREARRILAAALPPEEVAGLKMLFEELDANGDGLLSLGELREGLARKGEAMQGEEAAALLEAADLNGDGYIDYREFIAATYNMSRMEQQDVVLKAFKHFDLDGDGFITKEELATALSRLPASSRESAAALLAEADANRDGKLDYREFTAMVLAVQPGAKAANEDDAKDKVQPVVESLPGMVYDDKAVHGGSRHGGSKHGSVVGGAAASASVHAGGSTAYEDKAVRGGSRHGGASHATLGAAAGVSGSVRGGTHPGIGTGGSRHGGVSNATGGAAGGGTRGGTHPGFGAGGSRHGSVSNLTMGVASAAGASTRGGTHPGVGGGSGPNGGGSLLLAGGGGGGSGSRRGSVVSTGAYTASQSGNHRLSAGGISVGQIDSLGSRGRVGGWTAPASGEAAPLDSEDEEVMARARPSVAPDRSVRGGGMGRTGPAVIVGAA